MINPKGQHSNMTNTMTGMTNMNFSRIGKIEEETRDRKDGKVSEKIQRKNFQWSHNSKETIKLRKV